MEIELASQNTVFNQTSPLQIASIPPHLILFNQICTSPNFSQPHVRLLLTHSNFYVIDLANESLA